MGLVKPEVDLVATYEAIILHGCMCCVAQYIEFNSEPLSIDDKRVLSVVVTHYLRVNGKVSPHVKRERVCVEQISECDVIKIYGRFDIV